MQLLFASATSNPIFTEVRISRLRFCKHFFRFTEVWILRLGFFDVRILRLGFCFRKVFRKVIRKVRIEKILFTKS